MLYYEAPTALSLSLNPTTINVDENSDILIKIKENILYILVKYMYLEWQKK